MKVHESSTYAETLVKHGYSASNVCMLPMPTGRRMSIELYVLKVMYIDIKLELQKLNGINASI